MTEPKPSNYRIGNLIFLSYRRADSTAQTLALKLELEKTLSAVQVFMDTRTIPPGANFPEDIDKALKGAQVIIAIIGKNWCGRLDDGSNRIDDDQDWVRHELRIALQQRRESFIPVLLSDATAPADDTLPEDIKALASVNCLDLDVGKFWSESVKGLIQLLTEKFQFAIKDNLFKLPKPDKIKKLTTPYPWNVLQNELKDAYPDWIIEFSDHPESYRWAREFPDRSVEYYYKRIELRRNFEFKLYEESVLFLKIITDRSIAVVHHPRVLLLWTTVTVWISTWDVGFRITSYDVEFVKYLEKEYRKMMR